jgi:hypothetical protein
MRIKMRRNGTQFSNGKWGKICLARLLPSDVRCWLLRRVVDHGRQGTHLPSSSVFSSCPLSAQDILRTLVVSRKKTLRRGNWDSCIDVAPRQPWAERSKHQRSVIFNKQKHRFMLVLYVRCQLSGFVSGFTYTLTGRCHPWNPRCSLAACVRHEAFFVLFHYF